MPKFVPGLPAEAIVASLLRSPGNEIASGKFDGPESSAALVANAFGWFLNRASDLPVLPGVPAGHATSVKLEAEMRFPWSGGRHPWLDVGIETNTTLIGIDSKRYEPFRPQKRSGFAEVSDRPVWGERMGQYTQLRDALVADDVWFESLDAVQLIKHAYGIYTRAEKRASGAVLVYLYAEPKAWASGKLVDPDHIAKHRREVAQFANFVTGDSVVFVPIRWRDLLDQWSKQANLRPHVAALVEMFGPLG